MKKEVVSGLFLLGILLIMPLISAQEQVQTYSGFDRFVDDVRMFFSFGNSKINLTLEIREKEVNSALANTENGNDKEAEKNLERARKKLQFVQKRISKDVAENVKANIDGVLNKIAENKNLPEGFNSYILEEEKTILLANLTKKTFEYCIELAKENYDLMLKDEKCQNDNFGWLEKEVSSKIEEIQEEDYEEIEKQIEITMNNPKEATCDKIALVNERKECEKFKALAIRCEFQNDESACKEIGMFKDIQSDERKNYEQEVLNKYVPAECIEAGIKDGEECKKYIIALYQPDSECIEKGEVLDKEACEKKLIEEDKIPEECIKNRKVISPEECEKIIKEKSSISNREIKVDLEICTKEGYNTKKACEDFLLAQNLPQECIDANALTPEACEKLKLPQECQGQAFSNEECEAVFIKAEMPAICQQSGTYNFFECAKLLYKGVSDINIKGEIPYLEGKGIDEEDIPNECFKDDERTIFERDMECDEALIKKFGIMLPPPVDTSTIPEECMKDGTPVSPEECEEILNGGIMQNDLQDVIPKICQEAEVETPEECGKLLEQQRQKQGIGLNMPEECIGLNAEECEEIMKDKGIDIKKPEFETEEICCKKIINGKAQYHWDPEDVCISPEDIEGEIVSDDFCLALGTAIDKEDDVITEGVPKECSKLGVYDRESCEVIMSKINAQRIKDGNKIVIDKDGDIDIITSDQINQIADDADVKSDSLEPDITKANEIKKQVDVIDNSINTIEEVISTDKPSMTKDNEDVTPKPNIVDNDVTPGPQGIVGDQGYSDDEGGEDGESVLVTGEIIGTNNKKSFLGKIIKKIFG